MTSAYWQQWDKSDLDSWQGKDIDPPDDDEDFDDDDNDREAAEEEYGCTCGYYCMDCLGMSWRDFM
jgi:hypothetical protein